VEKKSVPHIKGKPPRPIKKGELAASRLRAEQGFAKGGKGLLKTENKKVWKYASSGGQPLPADPGRGLDRA